MTDPDDEFWAAADRAERAARKVFIWGLVGIAASCFAAGLSIALLVLS